YRLPRLLFQKYVLKLNFNCFLCSAGQLWNSRAELIIRRRLKMDEESSGSRRTHRKNRAKRDAAEGGAPDDEQMEDIDRETDPDHITPRKKTRRGRKSGKKTSVEKKMSVNAQSSQQREETELEREEHRFVHQDISQSKMRKLLFTVR
ncbi:hypothetical protein PENTCL1PPCAC_26246, partial [Pristionchus entomophagus]